MRKIIILNLLISLDILISVVNGNLPNKIIGGQTVQIEKYSYQVSIQYQNYHICGGSIISYYHILTAASCVSSDRNVYYANIEILSGTNDLMRQTIGWNINKVSRILLHEDYDPLNYWINDIALVLVTEPLILNFLRSAISLPSTATFGNIYSVTGWGINPLTDTMTRHLQFIYVQSFNPNLCRQKYYNELSAPFQNSQYCFEPILKTAKITWGNGGSSIIESNKIAGIISAISVLTSRHVVYTRLEKYPNWIENNMQKIFE